MSQPFDFQAKFPGFLLNHRGPIFWVSQNLRPRKLKPQTPGCLQNSDPGKLRPVGVSKTQTLPNCLP